MLNIGFMQGRLSDMVDGRIQSFPFSTWKEEFVIAHANNFNTIEWTIDSIDIENNPILDPLMHTEINRLKEKYSIDIPSITCDFFMEKPFFKVNNSKRANREIFLLDLKYLQELFKQQVMQFGSFGLHTKAPNSIIASTKSALRFVLNNFVLLLKINFSKFIFVISLFKYLENTLFTLPSIAIVGMS